MSIRLSILMPTIPSRRDKFNALYSKLESQVKGDEIEIISVLDNKKMTVGAKCNALVRMAQGESLTFVDDDDQVSPDYVSSILEALYERRTPDVVTFKIDSTLNWNSGLKQHAIIWPDVGDPNEEFHDGVVKRKPLRIAVWRTSLAKEARFPDLQYGEDAGWASQLWPRIETQKKIDKVLYWYQWSEAGTEAK